MTLSLPRLSSLSAIALGLGYTALTFGTALAPAPATSSNGPFYTAELAAPASSNRTVAGGVAWSCQGTTCVAGKGTSRPLRMCRELQRSMGDITAFTANGETLDAEKLARCNG
ncbi:hypothetical protein A9995_09265 [Erythrobacter sp. QSSC1-22B]|uniref:CC_3452 family protein n=1 Tax=Erythrobacter sp. QSSC1-22B TaxID=1860125 RepID=UPI000804EE8C|nr:hypothetical protein [Erythrobacter sp. QSSC1-22B]OBX18756.1 hypothetical protein A9995_09265 [Erythrobacter sp. QSSC1-22B]